MKDEILHSYPMYVSDWVRSETRIKLSSAGRGMFRELLDYCWIEGTLPNDPRALRSISGGTEKEFAAEWPIMEKNFTVDGDRLRHWKVDAKRPELVARKQQHSIAGKASVKARMERKGNGRLNGRSTDVETGNGVMFKPSISSSSTTTIPNNSIGDCRPLTPVESWVERLCELHPSPADPRYPSTFCTDNWLRLGEDGERFQEFMISVERGLIAWCAHWALDGNRFATSLDKWLSGGGWKKPTPKPLNGEGTYQQRPFRYPMPGPEDEEDYAPQ